MFMWDLYLFRAVIKARLQTESHACCGDAEGAFGVVEKRRFVDEDGHVTFVAVKKLKRQDIPPEVRASSPLHAPTSAANAP